VHLVASNGTFIRYLTTGILGSPKAVTISQNTVFLALVNPEALLKLEIF
jgi:hypothetical protein